MYDFYAQLLERLIIPNCKKIPNKSLCDVLKQNPSLLELDISNKVSPKVDVSVVDTLVRSCRYLTVLKLSDYRVEDPKTLLLLCGKRVVQEPSRIKISPVRLTNRGGSRVCIINTLADTSGTCSEDSIETIPHVEDISPSIANGSCHSEVCPPCKKKKATSIYSQHISGQSLHEMPKLLTVDDCVESTRELVALEDHLSSLRVLSSPPQLASVSQACSVKIPQACIQQQNFESVIASTIESSGACRSMEIDLRVSDSERVVPSLHMGELIWKDNGGEIQASEEEQENQRGINRQQVQPGVNPDNSDEDLYENDSLLTALNVEDDSTEYGCLDLKTLWLDNVNINDPVAAVLMQSLHRLRDLNLSDTDICNPWRLLDPSCTSHLVELEDLDIKSTALSRTALEMIPKFHPDLQRFSISSTTLPPHTYANIGRLTGVAYLELIGGQFYPCEPEEIFDKGIAPAISGIGKHLRSLNLTYFAHVKFEVIPKSCPKLEHLDLSFTSTSLWYPCESLGDCCPNLKVLNLAFCHVDAKEGNENDPQPVDPSKALEKMIGQPRNLEVLKMGGSAVTDDTLRNIFPRAVHPLRVLDLSRCSAATIHGVEYVWEKCPFIRRIDLTYCKEITVDNSNQFQKKCFKERPLFKLEGKLIWK